jgi:hypothetical protein
MTQLASDFDAPAALAAAVTFLAPTRHGALRLALSRASAPAMRAATNLRAAGLLAEAEPLLQWLEDWLGEPLDPEPSAAPAGEASTARLHWHWGELAATVDLPWQSLLACRPAPELAGFWRDAVRWDALAPQLVIAQEALTDDEWQALQEPGAGWLLRASFGADDHWPCELRLRAGTEVLAWPAQWQPGRRRLAWSDAPPLQRPSHSECTQALLAKPLHLTPPDLLGWHGESVCDCDADQPVSVLAAPAHGRRVLAAHLLPIGLRLPGAAAEVPGIGTPALQAGYVLRVDAD